MHVAAQPILELGGFGTGFRSDPDTGLDDFALGALEALRVQRWLGTAVAISLFAVSLWVAFGPGERACSMSIPFLQTMAPDALCRGAFGIGSLLIALFLGVFLYRAIRSRPEA